MNLKRFEGYTPGKWYAQREVIVAEDGTWVKPYHKDSWEGDRKWPSTKEQEANTQLMAAAPDLLSENKNMMETLQAVTNGAGKHERGYIITESVMQACREIVNGVEYE